MAKIHAKFIKSHGKNTVGDTTGLTPGEFAVLGPKGKGVVTRVNTSQPSPSSKSDPAVRADLKAQAREGRLPSNYSDLWSLASRVADRLEHKFESRGSDTLRAFLLENWETTLEFEDFLDTGQQE